MGHATRLGDYDSAVTHGLGERLSRFALAVALIVLGLVVLGEAYAVSVGQPLSLFSTWGGAAQLFLLFSAALTAVCARCASPSLVRAVDLGFPLAAGGAVTLALWGASEVVAPDLVALLLMTLVLLARAALVPSSASTSVGIGLLAFAPTVAATAKGFGVASELAVDVDAFRVLFAALWSVGAVAVAAMCSHVVYDLRARVSSALRLGPYSPVRLLGEGGVGRVYEAKHVRLHRPAAIKLLRGDLVSERALDRFEQEVQITARLQHPHTVSIYDYGRTATGTLFYVMELIDGMSLDDLVTRHGPLPSARVTFLLQQAVGALAEAHAQGLVHRDVKPSNIMVGARAGLGDWVTVVDFGLAHPVRGEVAAAVMGTPHFLAPEIIEGSQPVSAAADLYAVGVTAYFALTGGFPFEGATIPAVCAGHLLGAVEPPSARVAHPIDPALEQIVLRCLAKDPADRPESADALLASLAQAQRRAWDHERAHAWWVEHAPPRPAPLPPPEPGPACPWSGRRPALALPG